MSIQRMIFLVIVIVACHAARVSAEDVTLQNIRAEVQAREASDSKNFYARFEIRNTGAILYGPEEGGQIDHVWYHDWWASNRNVCRARLKGGHLSINGVVRRDAPLSPEFKSIEGTDRERDFSIAVVKGEPILTLNREFSAYGDDVPIWYGRTLGDRWLSELLEDESATYLGAAILDGVECAKVRIKIDGIDTDVYLAESFGYCWIRIDRFAGDDDFIRNYAVLKKDANGVACVVEASCELTMDGATTVHTYRALEFVAGGEHQPPYGYRPSPNDFASVYDATTQSKIK